MISVCLDCYFGVPGSQPKNHVLLDFQQFFKTTFPQMFLLVSMRQGWGGPPPTSHSKKHVDQRESSWHYFFA